MGGLETTYEPILLGSAVAFILSGIVAIQCLIYFKLYSNDVTGTKVLVGAVCIVDIVHTSFLVVCIHNYFITHFGNTAQINHIHWSIAFTIVITAVQTLITHWYFGWKVFKSSHRNWLIAMPIFIMASFRLIAALISACEMIRLQYFSIWIATYARWVGTAALSASAVTEIWITGWLCYFLREMRSQTMSATLVNVVDALTWYTLNTGGLTCVVTIASLICWSAMPATLIFLGTHFVIGKLYANSLLASLNTRKELRDMRSRNHKSAWPGNMTFLSAEGMRVGIPGNEPPFRSPTLGGDPRKELEVAVEHTVEHMYDRDENVQMADLKHASRDASLRSERKQAAWPLAV